MWKIINKTRVRSIADLTANGVWLINYTYSHILGIAQNV